MRWGLLLVFALASPPAVAQSPRIEKLVILERGIYHANTGLPHRTGSMGPVHRVHNIRLTVNTTKVPARRNMRFGLRYVLRGAPHGTTVELRMVTRFPEGGILDTRTGHRHFTQEYLVPVRIGVPGYRDFHLDEDWEAIPGRWVFEFWSGDRKLNEQEFCLFDPAAERSTRLCMDLVG